jgi:integrase
VKIYLRKYKDRQGQEQSGKTYWALYYVGGKRFHESLGTKDKRAAELIASERVRREELRRAGIADPFEAAQEKALKDHVDDFVQTLRARGVVERYVEDRAGCLRAFLGETGLRRLKDLDLPRASAWLTTFKDKGLSARSVNRRYQALKQFGLWLLKTRRVPFDPFDGLRPLNEEEDRRHVRRALAPEEAERLLEAARTRPIEQARAERIHAGVSPAETLRLTRLGEIRALVYAVALGTGLRKGEIRRLRWCDLDLARGRLTVPASSAKSRRAQTVPLSTALVATLAAARPAGAPPTDPVIPAGAFPNTTTFHRDLEAARIQRKDAEGRVLDVHALRTTFISWLAMTGAHPRVAQALARHASIETTMERYTDLALLDTAGTVERLPVPGGAGRARKGGAAALRTWDRRGEERGAAQA